MTSESITHIRLKEHGKKILLSQGFKEQEIFTEYRVKRDDGNSYWVDIAGVKPNKKVFVECGINQNPKKTKDLKNYCNKVIWLPYLIGTKPSAATAQAVATYDLARALDAVRRKCTTSNIVK